MSWTVQVASAGDASWTTYESALPDYFIKRLSAVGFASAFFPTLDGNSAPARDQLTRYVWDLGGGNETVHFEGFITDVRRLTNSDARRARCLSLEGLLWKMGTGSVRTWLAQSPYTIAQAAAAGSNPNGLLYNSSGNLRPIGATTLQYGADNQVPNQIDSGDVGVTMDFRADSSRALVNLQRLCLQSQFNNTDPDTTLRYGLEFFCRLEDAANNPGQADSTFPKLYLLRRREQSPAPAETFNIPDDLYPARRGQEGLTAADAVKVIGSGDGLNRLESSVIGSGGLEGIVADKSMLSGANAAGNTNATVMANRISQLLDPSTEVVTGWSFNHAMTTDLGDDATITQTGIGNETLRCFEIKYLLRRKGFLLTFGRPRPLEEDPFYQLDALAGGQAHGPQIMEHAAVDSGQPASNAGAPANTADGASVTTTLTFNTNEYDADHHEALWFFIQIFSYDPGTLNGLQGTFDLSLTISGTPIYTERVGTDPGGVGEGGRARIPLQFPAGFLRDVAGASGSVTSATLTTTNRSGAARDITAQLSAYLAG